MTRFNGKQDLSKMQLCERAKRRRRKHWLEQPHGTPPLEYRESGGPIFRPIPAVPTGFDFGASLAGLMTFLTLGHRKRKK